MAQPPNYNRDHDFRQDQIDGKETDGTALDRNFDSLSISQNTHIAQTTVTLNPDGTIKAGAVGPDQMDPAVEDEIATEAARRVEPYATSAAQSALEAKGDAADALASATDSEDSAQLSAGSSATADLSATEADAHASEAELSSTIAISEAIKSGNSANLAQVLAAESSMSEALAMQWAEYLAGPVMPPDPDNPTAIPPGSAEDWVEAVSQGHWSARWWAWWLSKRWQDAAGPVGPEGPQGPPGEGDVSADPGNVIYPGTDSGTYWDGDWNDLINVPATFPPESHTHDHSALTGVGADDHHAEVHAHDGVDGSGTVDYGDLTGTPAAFVPDTFAGAGTTGYVVDPVAELGGFLRDDGTFVVPQPSPIGGVELSYTFNTDTAAADPGDGTISVNNADQTLATELYASELTRNANDVGFVWGSLQIGEFVAFWEESGDREGDYYQVTGPVVDNGGWYTVPVTQVYGSGGVDNNRNLSVFFIGSPANKLPIGGETGQHLIKTSAVDFDTEWADPSGGGGDGHWDISGDDIFNTNVGYVGIGTDTPLATLEVHNTGAAASLALLRTDAASPETGRYSLVAGNAALTLNLTTDDNSFAQIAYRIQRTVSTNEVSYQQWGAGANPFAMTLTNGGDLGIGTTIPTAKLQVAGRADIAGIKVTGYDGGDMTGAGPELGYQSDTGYLQCYDRDLGEWIDGRWAGKDMRINATAGNIRFWTGPDGDVGERMIVAEDGNVGIGTDTPGNSQLAVVQDAGAGSFVAGLNITATSAAWNDTAGLVRISASGSVGGGALIIGVGEGSSTNFAHYADGHHTFGRPGATSMTIDTAGNVGMGNTSPASFFGSDLVVGSGAGSNGITIFAGATGYSDLCFADEATAGAGGYRGMVRYFHSDDHMEFRTLSTARMTITSAGNVGIGTTVPNNTTGFGGLTLNGSSGGQLSLADNNVRVGFLYATDSTVSLGNATAGVLTLVTNNFTRLTVDQNGNVGIGNASPGTFYGKGLVVGTGSGNNAITIFAGTTNNSDLCFADEQTTGVGSYRGMLRYNHTSNSLEIRTNAVAAMHIDSTGKVGINISNPSAELHVEGTIHMTPTTNGGDSTFRQGYARVSDGNCLFDMYGKAGGSQYTGRLRQNPGEGLTLLQSVTTSGIQLAANEDGAVIRFDTGGAGRWYIPTSGHLLPTSGIYNIASSATRVATLYVTTVNETSDRRLKTDIEELPYELALAFINELEQYRYHWIDEGKNGGKWVWGLIAQDVKAALDKVTGGRANDYGIFTESEGTEVVKDVDAEGNPTETTRTKSWGLNSAELIAPLMKVVKGQAAIIKTFEDRLTALEGK